jgi:hypothetical protein
MSNIPAGTQPAQLARVMSTRPLTARFVSFAVAIAVSVATAGPVSAQRADCRSCAMMADGDGCARGSVVLSCCCADWHPATPADRQARAVGTPFSSVALDGGEWPPVTVSVPGVVQTVPTHGYHSVPLHTLFSTFLI